MKNKFRFIAFCAIFLAPGFIRPSGSRGALGDIVHQIGVSGTNWGGGGITWRDGYLWENVRKKQYLYQRDPVTGKTVSTIWINILNGVAVAWDSKRGTWWLTDPYDPDNASPGTAYDDILQYKANGGNYISGFDPKLYDSDIFYDAQLDRIWIGSNNPPGSGFLAKYTVDGARDGKKIYPGFDVQGIARAGDYLWVGNFSEAPQAAYYIFQMKLDGTLTGVAFGTPGNAAVAALTFDGTYLWALVPSKGAIYQIDIGNGEPLPPPPPQATPTPDNSFTYTINTLFDDNAFTELIDTDNAVFNPEGSISYWCPAVRDGEVTGSVTYRIELPLVIETASLTAAGAVFWGEGELTVEVSPDGGSYHEVYTLARGGGDAVSDNQERDITASVAGSSTVYVRARMRAWSSYCSQFLRNGSTGTRSCPSGDRHRRRRRRPPPGRP